MRRLLAGRVTLKFEERVLLLVVGRRRRKKMQGGFGEFAVWRRKRKGDGLGVGFF